MFRKLNPLLHSELRLAVMSILIGVEEADFVYIRKQTGATAGNLSVQIDKLSEAGYITVEKGFKGKSLAPPAARPTQVSRLSMNMSMRSRITSPCKTGDSIVNEQDKCVP